MSIITNHDERMFEMQKFEKENLLMLQKYSALAQSGCFYIQGFIKRRGWDRLAIYSPDYAYECRLLINELAASRTEIFLITDKKTTFNGYRTIKLDGTDRIDNVDAIIVANCVDINKAIDVLKGRSDSPVFKLNDIVEKIYNYENNWCLISHLRDLENRGIETHIVETPRAECVKNQSEYETLISLKHYKTRGITESRFDELYPLCGLDAEYTKELLLKKLWISPKIAHKDYYVAADIKSEYVNITNHVRWAIDSDNSATKVVYIVGDSTAEGNQIMDKDTIGNHLQKLLNTKVPRLYRVATLATGGIGIDLIYRRLKDTDISSGDIVVIIGCKYKFDKIFRESCRENNVDFCDSQRYFNRPHSMGEVFIDTTHLNPNGCKRIATAIYERMSTKQKGKSNAFRHYFRDAMDFVPTHIKQLPEATRDFFFTNQAFQVFLRELEQYNAYGLKAGAIVMNCNPFTIGHQYLIEYAASQVDRLFIFIVEEDKSHFTFTDRFELVQKGVANMSNVKILSSSRFVISGVTLPEYFIKGKNPDAVIDATMDLNLFGKYIAPTLGITVRFAGEEPLDKVTLQYNQAMARILPQHGIKFEVIPRKESDGAPISASRVRALLKEQNFGEIAKIVPQTTLDYLKAIAPPS
ncbi:hypothetical protein FACS18949_11280 [Clostridia bacterium]|nr:hypothetical protein FACS18949_11280 [Clostridia bacterium]